MRGILSLTLLASSTLALWPANVTEYFYEQKLAHFNQYGKQDTFKQRYLVQTKYWDFENGPILFYTGNEGTIWSFFNNTGYYTDTVAE